MLGPIFFYCYLFIFLQIFDIALEIQPYFTNLCMGKGKIPIKFRVSISTSELGTYFYLTKINAFRW